MNIFTLSLANVRFRLLGNLFNILILALGIALIITLLQVSNQLEQRFSRDLEGIDLVVGAKGSPVQLILSSVFHLDIPNGNIPLKEADALSHNPMIAKAIPLALGDNYEGFRIVGTDTDYPAHYNASLATGAYWTAPMQSVLGSEVARVSGIKTGQSFVGSHGLTAGGEEHKEFPYTVVGILQPTGSVMDRLILTSVESVWNIHEHHHHDADDKDDDDDDHEVHDASNREITSLLISYKSPVAALTLPRFINKSSSMQAASPAFETARLLKIFGVGSDAIEGFAGLLVAIATLGFFLTLLAAVQERRYDIILLRSLGATRAKIMGLILTEALMLGGIGTLLGLLLGHGFAMLATRWIEQTRHMQLGSYEWQPYEAYVALAALLVSVVAAVIPALLAYRVNVAKVLSKGL